MTDFILVLLFSETSKQFYFTPMFYSYLDINKGLRPLFNFTIFKVKNKHRSNLYETDSVLLTNLYMTMFSSLYISMKIVLWSVFCIISFALHYCLGAALPSENQCYSCRPRFLLSKLLQYPLPKTKSQKNNFSYIFNWVQIYAVPRTVQCYPIDSVQKF